MRRECHELLAPAEKQGIGAEHEHAKVRRNPITGIAGCCARAASGQAAAALPSSVMNSRRLKSDTAPPPQSVRRTISLPQTRVACPIDGPESF
jgi:hypothetical protein